MKSIRDNVDQKVTQKGSHTTRYINFNLQRRMEPLLCEVFGSTSLQLLVRTCTRRVEATLEAENASHDNLMAYLLDMKPIWVRVGV